MNDNAEKGWEAGAREADANPRTGCCLSLCNSSARCAQAEALRTHAGPGGTTRPTSGAVITIGKDAFYESLNTLLSQTGSKVSYFLPHGN